MIVERTEHPGWLSNAYLVADGPGGHGVLVDGNGVTGPLVERIERDGIAITHVLLTHEHGDHVVDAEDFRARFGAPVLAHELTARGLSFRVDGTLEAGEVVRSGSLELRTIHTPGHSAGHVAFLAGGTDLFTADLLFRGSVGGTMGPGGSYSDLRRSVERVLELPPQTRIHPGHTEPTTVGAELETNPFVRVWRGLDPEGTERCRVGGRAATLVVWARDYDGGHKAWVRFDSGEDAIAGGSRVERG